VVCRIANTRNSPNVKGYIEVEFLEPATDFWGIHKPEAQSHVSTPPAAVAAQPKTETQAQTVSSLRPEAPAEPHARVEPAAAEAVAPMSKAPSFEDLAGVVQVSPQAVARNKTPERTPRFPAQLDDSTPHTIEDGRSYSPAAISAPTTELTSLSATWEGAPASARKPSTSGDVLGKFSHTTSEPGSNGSSGKTLLIVGGAAVILIGLGAEVFFMRRGNSVTTAVAPVDAVSQPAAQVPAAPVSTPAPEPPVGIDQPVAEQTPQASRLTPAISSAAPTPMEIADTSTSSLQQAPRRKTDTVAATQSTQSAVKPADTSTPRPQVARKLKMRSPTVESRSGKLVDSSIPIIDDAMASRTLGVPGGGLVATVSRPNVPPPPGGFLGAGSSGTIASEPKLISSTRPVYPQVAKQSSVEGDVIVAADIDATGKVVGAKATAGPMYLRQAAVDAVRNWKYEPANLNGKPTSAQVSIKIQFRLK
jgi:TonB family protein